ncbi:MAG: dihydrodipicolinate synthase family protein [Thermomicrobiales bacterium]|nr:dihydrodipicolinate synthase family protein [Thermomicrobiales bacterium]
MALPANFGGVVPPICTPFTDSGEIDTASLERLLRYLIDGGVTGIFALGTTSETGALTDAQRTQVIETTVATVAGEVPVIVGALASATNVVIEYAQQAQTLGVDAIVALSPYYHKFSEGEIANHFRAVKAAIDIPLIAYNIPQMIGTELSSANVVTLAKEGVIAGVKDSSGNEASFRASVLNTRGIQGFSVFTGGEITVDYSMFAGAAGIVPGLGNVDPAGYRRLYDAAITGDWDAARNEQERLVKLFAILSQATPGRVGISSGVIGGYKTALREMGVIDSNAMAVPFQPLNVEEATKIRAILVEVGLV